MRQMVSLFYRVVVDVVLRVDGYSMLDVRLSHAVLLHFVRDSLYCSVAGRHSL